MLESASLEHAATPNIKRPAAIAASVRLAQWSLDMTQLSGLRSVAHERETKEARLFLDVLLSQVMCLIAVVIRLVRGKCVANVRGTSRSSALAAVVLLAMSLTACSGDDSAADAAPEPTVPEEVLWAGSVCTAFDDLLATVDALGEGLVYEPTADDDVLDQYVTQLGAQMDDINGAIEELTFTVGQAPIDYKESASNVVNFGRDISVIVAAKDETVEHIESAIAAESNVDKGLAAAQAAITGTTTLSLTRDLLGGLGDVLSERKADLDDAFGQAIECQ